jgi:hypothetical protein
MNLDISLGDLRLIKDALLTHKQHNDALAGHPVAMPAEMRAHYTERAVSTAALLSKLELIFEPDEPLVDVTSKVSFDGVDDENLPLTRCVCGERFKPWSQIVGIYRDLPWSCPKCSAKLVFSNGVRVFQIKK